LKPKETIMAGYSRLPLMTGLTSLRRVQMMLCWITKTSRYPRP
jgi:hypothetical protein